jgi:tetratricopeptide (TPR) repeat protein
MKLKRIAAVLIIIAGLAIASRPVRGCGPFFPELVFTFSFHPDFPLERFAGGQLGVLQPTYARSYLVVAYRYLSGKTLDEEERMAVVALWEERIGLRTTSDKQGLANWLEARKRAHGTVFLPEIRTFGAITGSYSTYLNCPEDAFETAAGTLRERIQSFGADSLEVREWVAAQDQVFRNCRGYETPPSPYVPAALVQSAPALLRADRAYQIAAANFYAARFDDAQEAFESIARDPTSPWSGIAPYLVARCLVRKATLGSGPGEVNLSDLRQAEEQLERILSDKRLESSQPAAQRLLGFVDARLRPLERARQLATSLLQQTPRDTLRQDLCDYTVLLDKFIEGEWHYGMEEEKRREIQALREKQLNELRRQDELTDGLLTFQDRSKESLEHALARWQESSSLPWLVAAISKIDAQDPKSSQLLEASAKVEPSSPAFASLAFHSVRLLIELGKTEEARSYLDKLLSARKPNLPPSARNLLLTQRTRLARNLDEFLHYAARVPTAISSGDTAGQIPDNLRFRRERGAPSDRPYFDFDASSVFTEKMPTRLLAEAALRTQVPKHLRRELAVGAWTRSLLLGQDDVTAKLNPIMEENFPELKAQLRQLAAAEGREAKDFTGALILLNHPGLEPHVGDGRPRRTAVDRIDDYRDNWWCSFTPHSTAASSPWERYPVFWAGKPLALVYPEGKVNSPAFLDEAQKAAADAEWKRLGELGSGPSYLSRKVVEWARQHLEDPRVPKALHLAVRSTRYGCADAETSKYSKAAFQLLHRRYPKSEWAKKTKYWY